MYNDRDDLQMKIEAKSLSSQSRRLGENASAHELVAGEPSLSLVVVVFIVGRGGSEVVGEEQRVHAGGERNGYVNFNFIETRE